MFLIFVRHAEAGKRDPEKWPDDDLRPITPEGRKKQAECARAMKALGLEADLLFTSPLLRAVQTAEVIQEVYGIREAATTEALGHECSVNSVVMLVNTLPPEATIMLVGHEPSFSRVAAAFIGRSADAGIELRKSGVIGIEFEGAAAAGSGTLHFLLKPGFLRKVKKR